MLQRRVEARNDPREGVLVQWADEICAMRGFAQSGGLHEACSRLRAVISSRAQHDAVTVGRLCKLLARLPVTNSLLSETGAIHCVEQLVRSPLAELKYQDISIAVLASHLLLQWGRLTDHPCTVEVVAGPVMPSGIPPFAHVVQTTQRCDCDQEPALRAKLIEMSEKLAQMQLLNQAPAPPPSQEEDDTTGRLLNSLVEVRQQLLQKEQELSALSEEFAHAESIEQEAMREQLKQLQSRMDALREECTKSVAHHVAVAERAQLGQTQAELALRESEQRSMQMEEELGRTLRQHELEGESLNGRHQKKIAALEMKVVQRDHAISALENQLDSHHSEAASPVAASPGLQARVSVAEAERKAAEQKQVEALEQLAAARKRIRELEVQNSEQAAMIQAHKYELKQQQQQGDSEHRHSEELRVVKQQRWQAEQLAAQHAQTAQELAAQFLEEQRGGAGSGASLEHRALKLQADELVKLQEELVKKDRLIGQLRKIEQLTSENRGSSPSAT